MLGIFKILNTHLYINIILSSISHSSLTYINLKKASVPCYPIDQLCPFYSNKYYQAACEYIIKYRESLSISQFELDTALYTLLDIKRDIK